MSVHPEIEGVLDRLKADAIVDLANRAASYWNSIVLAAERREQDLIVFHASQVALVTKEAFKTIRELAPKEAPK